MDVTALALQTSFCRYLLPATLEVFTSSPGLSAGSRLLHHELLHVHLLGSVLRLPGRVSGEGVRAVRLRLWDPGGEWDEAAFTRVRLECVTDLQSVVTSY